MKAKNTTLNLQKLYKCEKGADVEFVLKSKEFDGESKVPAHKIVLAAASSVFDSMFFGDLKEGAVVNIVDASFEAFCEFLQFFYMDEIELTVANIFEVIKLLDKYDVQQYVPFCDRFLWETVTTDLVCLYYELAITYNFSKELITRFEATIINETADVLEGASFKNCSKTVLKKILEMDQMDYSECNVFRATISWANELCKNKDLPASPQNLRAELEDCLTLIRFPTMTVQEYPSCMENYPDLLDYNVLLDIWQYIISKRALTSANQFSTNPRKIAEVNVSFWSEAATIKQIPRTDRSFISFSVIFSKLTLVKEIDASVGFGVYRLNLDAPVLCEPGNKYEFEFEIGWYTTWQFDFRSTDLQTINDIKFNLIDNHFIKQMGFKRRP